MATWFGGTNNGFGIILARVVSESAYRVTAPAQRLKEGSAKQVNNAVKSLQEMLDTAAKV